jgi:atrial natriuretic peptide-converting enzyme
MSFDDIGDSDDLVIFDVKKSQLIDPNQSSSDSSRSQTTIDTGYISSFETTTNNQRKFRGRFSSEDTQSSLDSYLSSDLQRADTIDSLQSNFTDSPFILKKNVNIFNFDQRLTKKISSSCSIDSDNSKLSLTPNNKTPNGRGGRLPPVPARKTIRQRTPPAPPLRTSQLALHDISSSSNILFNFITFHSTFTHLSISFYLLFSSLSLLFSM